MKNINEYFGNIGKQVKLIDDPLFDDGCHTHTVMCITINPSTGNPGYIFDNSEDVIDCQLCELVVLSTFKKRKRTVIIDHPEFSKRSVDSISDYDIQITENECNGVLYNQKIAMTYGHVANWSQGVPGSLAATLHDDGDNIHLGFGHNIITVDYSEFSQLFALLLYYNNESKLDTAQQTYSFHKIRKT